MAGVVPTVSFLTRIYTPGVVRGGMSFLTRIYTLGVVPGVSFLTRIYTPGVVPRVSFLTRIIPGCSSWGEFSHQG